MLELRTSNETQIPISIGRGGYLPALLLGGIFAAAAGRLGVPVATAAVVGALGGAASLLFHEFGHVRAADDVAGIGGGAISLIWLGAATRFEGAYASGRAQARVAAGGPTASFFLAVCLACASQLTTSAHNSRLLLMLALFNGLLAVMNLVPVRPLDGHKLLTALLWAATGSQQEGSRILRRAGACWLALEVPAGLLLVTARPQIGLPVVLLGGSFFVQKRLARRHRA
jgi:Zn-dependent protease